MSEYNQKPFPVPEDNLILIDLDETIIDTNYQLPDPAIIDAVERAQARGWTIGLNSNTPYESLAGWAKQFGMNGPIVAEKGAVIAGSDGNLRYDQDEAKAFAESYAAIAGRLGTNGVVVWAGKPVQAIRDGLRVGQPGDTAVLLNDMRLCSLSFFVRKVNQQGDLELDANATAAVADTVKDLYPSFEDLELEVNPVYGIVIAVRSRNNKRSGSQTLQQQRGAAGRFAMVGNAMMDFVGSDIAVQYAVCNATEEYKQVADYVASGVLASGVAEILDRLGSAPTKGGSRYA